MEIDTKIIVERIKNACKTNEVSVKCALESCLLSRNFIYDLEHRGSFPSIEAFYRLADYLNVSIDYLLGRTDTIAKINSHNTIRGNNNIIGNGNSIGERLSEQETALLGLFKNFDVVKQAQLLAYAAELDKEV